MPATNDDFSAASEPAWLAIGHPTWQHAAVRTADDASRGVDPLHLRPPPPKSNVVFGLTFALIPLVAIGAFLASGAPAQVTGFPLLFVLLGLALALGRRGAIVDKPAKTITTWWGLWFPIGRTAHVFDEVAYVSIGREVRGSSKSRVTVYPVRVQPDGVELVAPQRYKDARRAAEQSARYLGVLLRDSSTGTEVTREPGSLDQPLRDRLLQQGARPTAPGAPPARLAVGADGDKTICVLPPAGIGLINVFSVLAGLLMSGAVVAFIVSNHPPAPLVAAAAVVAALPILGTALPLLSALLGRDKVVFSAEGVELRRWEPYRSSQRIPVQELEELFVVNEMRLTITPAGGGASVVARSDRMTLYLGRSLTTDEAEWLRDAIIHAVCSTMFGFR